jgi:hydroxyethylthiazole kinase-like uncharacterized protein yjeF
MSGTPLDEKSLKRHPLPPVRDGDKDSKGRILVIAGSREVPGAAILCATAAMRAGAGKLQIATEVAVAADIGIAMVESKAMALPKPAALTKMAAEVDAVVAGPGMSSDQDCERIAAALLSADTPLALDAALLHALEPLTAPRSSPPILLPHAGELASLLDCDEGEVERAPVECGRRAAQLYRSIVLVKGVTSHVVTPDGEWWTYDGGAPGLGVSGSGDVLAGIVGGLLARRADPLSALLWSVWLHGEAGARLARKVGPIGFLAREIADEIPALLPR